MPAAGRLVTAGFTDADDSFGAAIAGGVQCEPATGFTVGAGGESAANAGALNADAIAITRAAVATAATAARRDRIRLPRVTTR